MRCRRLVVTIEKESNGKFANGNDAVRWRFKVFIIVNVRFPRGEEGGENSLDYFYFLMKAR